MGDRRNSDRFVEISWSHSVFNPHKSSGAVEMRNWNRDRSFAKGGISNIGNWLSENQAIGLYKWVFWFYKILGIQGIIYRYPLGKMIIEGLNLKEPWYDTHATF